MKSKAPYKNVQIKLGLINVCRVELEFCESQEKAADKKMRFRCQQHHFSAASHQNLCSLTSQLKAL